MKRRRYLIDDSAYTVFVTTTIIQWLPVFTDQALAGEALKIFEQEKDRHALRVFAYVLMPSHLHAVIKSAHKGDLSVFMRRWKSKTARFILDYCQQLYPDWHKKFAENALAHGLLGSQKYQVWMPRFDDYAIRTEEEMVIKINYIHGNPLKHDLVDDVEEYPYSSYADYNEGQNGYVTIDCGQGKP